MKTEGSSPHLQTHMDELYVNYPSFFSIILINTPAIHRHAKPATTKRNFTLSSPLTYTTATTHMKIINVKN